jgi:2-oxoglutarate ferredoxin oxidoreductase subunit alpha
MNANEALAEAAIRAGCRHYYGYPITPQNELIGYMAKRMREVGGVFLQCESELAAINMVFGAAAAGKRAMTSSSSPGISLMQEGISYLAGCELPAVIVNVQRAGPGLGNIAPAQADYFQATRGGGHGDYRTIAIAPHTLQETLDLISLAFDLADKYRMPVMYLLDGQLAQMLELGELPPFSEKAAPDKPWALTGCKGRKPNIIRSLLLDSDVLEDLNRRLSKRYDEICSTESRWEEMETADAEVLTVAHGTAARLCKEAVRDARKQGLKLGLLRPITLWPFPVDALKKAAEGCKGVLTVELSYGQMVEDVKLALPVGPPVYFYGRTGGNLPLVSRIRQLSQAIAEGRPVEERTTRD